MESNKNKEYYLGLDILRVVLMLLGIVIHAKYFVGYDNPFYEENGFRNSFLEYSVYFVQIFRMDAFFAISGFFSSLVLLNNGKESFKKSRLKRVLYPFFFSYILLIPFAFKFLDRPNILENYHLWFLVVLLAFSLLDYIFNLDKHFQKIIDKEFIFVGILGILFVFLFLTMKLNIKSIMLSLIYSFFRYLPYYILGKYLYLKRSFFSTIKLTTWSYIILILSIFLSLYLYKLRLDVGNIYPILNIGRIIFTIFTSVLIVLFLFVRTINIKGKPSKTLQYFVESSLVVYLFHFPFVHAIGLNIRSNEFFSNSFLYFSVLTISTFIFSFIMFELLKRNKISRFMFGIKEKK